MSLPCIGIMDRLEAMLVFAAVVDTGSLSAAGRRLEIPLATVSRKPSDLEAHLKTRLLTRSTRQLALTDAGRAYLAASRQILGRVDEAERPASGAYATANARATSSSRRRSSSAACTWCPLPRPASNSTPTWIRASCLVTATSTCSKNMWMWDCALANSRTAVSLPPRWAAFAGWSAPARLS